MYEKNKVLVWVNGVEVFFHLESKPHHMPRVWVQFVDFVIHVMLKIYVPKA